MTLGSHNTMTYLPASKWWMNLFRWCWRTQTKTLADQLALGVSLIDIRVRFDDDQKVVLAHGYYEAKERHTLKDFVKFILETIADHRTSKDIYIRLILEVGKGNYWQEVTFKSLCSRFKKAVPDYITLTGGYRKCDWLQLVDFADIPLTQCVSSMADDARWYERICPRIYANRMNAVNADHYIDYKNIVLFDFL